MYQNHIASKSASYKYFVCWWVFRTLLGFVIGVAALGIAFIVLISVGDLIKLNYNSIAIIPLLIAAFSIFGAVVGNIQWPDRLLDVLPRKKWMAANAIGSITGLLGAYYIFTFGPPLFSKLVSDDSSDFRYAGHSTLSNQWFLTILIWSIALGFGLGVAKWLILRAQAVKAYWMIFADIGGILAGFLLAILLSSGIDFSYMFVYLWCSLPIMVGIIGGIATKYILFHQQKA